MKHGKKFRNIAEKVDDNKEYTLEEAFAFIKENAAAKFDESVEVHVKLNINPKKSDEAVRATAELPYGTGRTKRVAVVTSTKAKEAETAGAVLVGGDEIIEQISAGKTVPGSDFDVLLATPEMMPKLAKVAKILGPKGLMPSPKNETVTAKVAEAVEMLSKGKRISFKNDDSGNVHQVIGKASFSIEELSGNFAAFREALQRAKSDSVKGRFVISASVCSTMGPGMRISF